MKRLLIIFPLLGILSSCGIYGTYSRDAAGIAPQDSPSVESEPLSWRSVCTDAPLQALIDTALRHNTDLQTALLRTAEARATLRSAKLSFLPSAGLTAGAASSSDWDPSAGAEASWQIDLFGRKLNASRKAAASVEESEAYEKAVRTEVIASVAEAYYTLLTLDAQLAISEQTLLNWDKTIGVLESLKLAGKTNDIAILQAKAKKLNLESSSLSLKGSIAMARNALCTLMGVPPREIVRSSPETAPVPEVPRDGVSMAALLSRPDVKQAEAALKQAFYGTQAARADFFPDLTLSGTLGWTSAAGVITDPAAWIASAAASIAAPLFRQGLRRAELEIAESRQEQARLQYVQTLLEAGNEVNDALISCQTAQDRMEIDTRQRTGLGEAVEKIELMMRYSTTNYLEVLTAQQSFLDAEIKVVEDRLALIRGSISLFRAMGVFSTD